MSPPGLVVLGGGNGIATVLSGLAAEGAGGRSSDLCAIVATADDGGSSGRLRMQRGGLPPGDLRTCLLALTPPGAPLRGLFEHRYTGCGDLAGHSLGNLVLAALAETEGDWLRACRSAGRLLGVRGRVLPVSLDPVELQAEAVDGRKLSGESVIGRSRPPRRLWLEPASVRPAPGVCEEIRSAEMIVIGPGSLYTSLLPVLLVPGVAEAIRSSAARRVLVANLMTQPGETLGLDLAGHLEALERHVGPGLVQDVVVSDPPADAARLAPYAEAGAAPVLPGRLDARPERFHRSSLHTPAGKVRHDERLLARALLDLLPAVHGTDRWTRS